MHNAFGDSRGKLRHSFGEPNGNPSPVKGQIRKSRAFHQLYAILPAPRFPSKNPSAIELLRRRRWENIRHSILLEAKPAAPQLNRMSARPTNGPDHLAYLSETI